MPRGEILCPAALRLIDRSQEPSVSMAELCLRREHPDGGAVRVAVAPWRGVEADRVRREAAMGGVPSCSAAQAMPLG